MTRTLLLADGSVTIQRVVELTFAHEDIRVTTVGDGRRALQVLENESPDVVLVDVDLPEMDGYALAAHMRRVPRLKKVPVLLLAGAFEPVDQDKARDVGSDGVIMKPFEPQVVVTRVKELIDQRDRQATPMPKSNDLPVASSTASAARATPDGTEAPEVPKARPEPAFMRVKQRQHEVVEEAPAVEPLELPTRPIWESGGATTVPFPSHAAVHATASILPPPTPVLQPVPQAPAPPKVTLANAFTALLAAEQSAQPSQAAAPALSEASIEDAVRRVLVRMTDDLVRRIVLDTAERLIREEIEKIKANPE